MVVCPVHGAQRESATFCAACGVRLRCVRCGGAITPGQAVMVGRHGLVQTMYTSSHAGERLYCGETCLENEREQTEYTDEVISRTKRVFRLLLDWIRTDRMQPPDLTFVAWVLLTAMMVIAVAVAVRSLRDGSGDSAAPTAVVPGQATAALATPPGTAPTPVTPSPATPPAPTRIEARGTFDTTRATSNGFHVGMNEVHLSMPLAGGAIAGTFLYSYEEYPLGSILTQAFGSASDPAWAAFSRCTVQTVEAGTFEGQFDTATKGIRGTVTTSNRVVDVHSCLDTRPSSLNLPTGSEPITLNWSGTVSGATLRGTIDIPGEEPLQFAGEARELP